MASEKISDVEDKELKSEVHNFEDSDDCNPCFNDLPEKKDNTSKENCEEKSNTEAANNSIEDIQASWQIPAIAQFVSLFHEDLKLPELEIEELEEGFLQSSELGCKTLKELLVSLLKGIYPSGGVSDQNYEKQISRAARAIWRDEHRQDQCPLSDQNFYSVAASVRLDFVHSLCCKRAAQPDAQETLKGMDTDTLRVQPLGSDDVGNDYWYFYGTRLYKQQPIKREVESPKTPAKNRSRRGRPRKQPKVEVESEELPEDEAAAVNFRWSVECSSMADWEGLADRFKNSKSATEQSLFQTLAYSFLPALNEIYREKEKKLQQKLRVLVPPRRMVTRTTTRRQEVTKVASEEDVEGSHRRYLARERAQRYEERNQRLEYERLQRLQGRSERLQNRQRRSSRRNASRDRYDESEDEDYVPRGVRVPSPQEYPDEEESPEESSPDEQESSDQEESATPQTQKAAFVPLASRRISDIKIHVLKVMTDIRVHRDSWPFLAPVDEAYAPAYYDIIKEPMDLGTMTKRLKNNYYNTVREIDDDFKKIVANCKLYNGENHDMSKMAVILQGVFRNGLYKLHNVFPVHLPKQQNEQKKKRKREEHLETLEVEAEGALESPAPPEVKSGGIVFRVAPPETTRGAGTAKSVAEILRCNAVKQDSDAHAPASEETSTSSTIVTSAVREVKIMPPKSTGVQAAMVRVAASPQLLRFKTVSASSGQQQLIRLKPVQERVLQSGPVGVPSAFQHVPLGQVNGFVRSPSDAENQRCALVRPAAPRVLSPIKVALPPSQGEIVLVPGQAHNPGGLTLHLVAQPSPADPSAAPVRHTVEVRPAPQQQARLAVTSPQTTRPATVLLSNGQQARLVFPTASNLPTTVSGGIATTVQMPVMTQVQLPQFVQSSYYLVTDQNAVQDPASYPVINMQPVSFPSR